MRAYRERGTLSFSIPAHAGGRGPAPEFDAALDAHPEAVAGLVFTPSYYGTSANVQALANACHEHDLPLITDDAWGLDYKLGGHPELPQGALSQGADLAIGSVHKTLTGLTQTSVLSVGSDRIDIERLKLCFELEESTSASALLLSSIDGARRQFVREGTELLDRAVKSARPSPQTDSWRAPPTSRSAG